MTNVELQQLIAIIAVVFALGSIQAALIKQAGASTILVTISLALSASSMWFYFHPHLP